MTTELLPETPSQTAGPYVHIGLAPEAAGNPTRPLEIGNRMAFDDAPGEHLVLVGSVYDGNGQLICFGLSNLAVRCLVHGCSSGSSLLGSGQDQADCDGGSY